MIVLQGYHVQITARSDGDLTPEGIVQKVADSSGSKYSFAVEPPPVTATPKPPVASKPVFTPARTGGIGRSSTAGISRPTEVTHNDDDGWGPDAPPVTRTQLEKVQPAYRPTKVNMQELRSGRQETTETDAENRGDVVKGGYQPVGKVDIAAIRRQAREAGELKDDRPEPVKGAYEPVGKVDIAAIRAKAQKPSDTPTSAGVGAGVPSDFRGDSESTKTQVSAAPSSSERLTSLPKPKISNKVATSSTFTATKPPLPTDVMSKPPAAAAQVGSASRTFANEGGKTPAQQWAEKKAKVQGTSGVPTSTVHDQQSGNADWKSSYTGKTWAPVQTTNTGKSFADNAPEQGTDSTANERSETEVEASRQNVSTIRDQFTREVPKPIPLEEKPRDTSSTEHTVPIPNLPSGPTEAEIIPQTEGHREIPSPPRQARSPSPPTPPQVRETSPIRVAMPVGRGFADAHDEQYSPPPAVPSQSLQQAVPDDKDLEDSRHDLGRAAAETTAGHGLQTGGIEALVQYDYEKAEDNEIDLKEGEYVTDIEMVDRDWWLGVNTHGERGLFPSNYVEAAEGDQENEPARGAQGHVLETDVPGPSTDDHFAPPPQGTAKEPTAAALYDYEAAEDNELSFPEGAEITGIVSGPVTSIYAFPLF